MQRCTFLRRWAASVAKTAFVVVVLATSIARAGSLAELVPSDVGICVQGRRLPTQFHAMLSGPLGQRILAHHAVKKWHSERDGDLKQLKRDLEAHFDMPFAELCDGVAGEEILLGVWPDEVPGRGDGPALLLVQARKPDILRRALQAICAEHEKSGELLPSEMASVGGQQHELQVLAPDGDEQRLYLVAVRELGVLSNSKPLAIGALERQAAANAAKDATAANSLAALPAYAAAAARLPADRTVTLFVNPRAWDQSLDVSVNADGDQDQLSAAERDKLLAAWRSTEYVAAAASLGASLRFDGVWHARAEELPIEARELADATSGRAGFLEFVPKDALVALAGRAQWGRLARLV